MRQRATGRDARGRTRPRGTHHNQFCHPSGNRISRDSVVVAAEGSRWRRDKAFGWVLPLQRPQVPIRTPAKEARHEHNGRCPAFAFMHGSFACRAVLNPLPNRKCRRLLEAFDAEILTEPREERGSTELRVGPRPHTATIRAGQEPPLLARRRLRHERKKATTE